MRRFIWATGWLILAAVSAQGQGRTDYFNTETVQVDPLAIVQVGGKQFLAVANTPDNAVELYRTEETLPITGRFVARVRTGLEPASLLWVPELSRLYVANALSDAITVIRLDPGPNGTPTITVEQTTWIGDEPVALAYYAFEEALPGGGTMTRHSLFVAHRDQDAIGWRDALTLEPILPGTMFIDATVQKGDIDQDGQPDLIALKAPATSRCAAGRCICWARRAATPSTSTSTSTASPSRAARRRTWPCPTQPTSRWRGARRTTFSSWAARH